MKRLGIISDTHSVLNNKVFSLFKNVDMILHAGDVGDDDIITQLNSVAPTTVVYGNTDDAKVRDKTKKEITLSVDGIKIHLSHNEKVKSEDFDIIIQGHTHLPEMSYKGKSLYLNPGSANAERSIPAGQASVIILELKGKEIISSSVLFL